MLNNLLKKKLSLFSYLLAIVFYLSNSGLPLGILFAQEIKNPDPLIMPPLPAQYDKIARQCGFIQSTDRTISLWQCIIIQNPKPSTDTQGIGNEIVWMIPINQQGQWETPQTFDPLLTVISTNRLIGEILAVNQHGELLVRPPAQPPAGMINYRRLRLVQPLPGHTQQYSVQELSTHFAHVRHVWDGNGQHWLVWDDGSSKTTGTPKQYTEISAISRQGKEIWLKSTIANNDDFQNPYGLASKDSETVVWAPSQAKNNTLTTRLFCISNTTKDYSDSNYINFPASNFRIALPLVKENKILLLGTAEEKGHQWIVGWVVYVDKGCKALPWGRLQLPNHFNQQQAYSWLEHAIVTEKDEIVIFYGQQWDVRYIDFERQPDREKLRADLWAFKINPDLSRDIIWDRKIISREDPVSEAFSINLWEEAQWQKIGLKNWGLSLAYLPQIQKIFIHPMIPKDVEKTKIFPTQPRVYQLRME